MSQFDVHHNIGRHRASIPYVLIVQSALFDKSCRRVAVPLVALEQLAGSAPLLSSPINPVFDIQGRQVIMNPLEIVSVGVEQLGAPVTSLAGQGDSIIAALDELFSRAWG